MSTPPPSSTEIETVLPAPDATHSALQNVVAAVSLEEAAQATPETLAIEAQIPDSATQVALIPEDVLSELPEEVLAFLVRAVPPREAWAWLNERDQSVLLYKATLGFQRNIAALRQPIVRTRLGKHLESQPAALRKWLHFWLDTSPRVVDEVLEQNTDEQLRLALPELSRRHGIESVVLALVIGNRRDVLEELDELLGNALEENDAVPDSPSLDASEAATPGSELLNSPQIESASEAVASAEEVEKLRIQRDEARERSHTLQSQLNMAQSTLATARERHGREMREKATQLKRETLRAEAAEAKLQESQKLLDRTSRRLKHDDKELEEALVENKRLKRQLRRNQEINEELRKQIAQMTAKVEHFSEKYEPKPLLPPQPGPKPAAAKVLSPLDQMFIWKSDGRQFHVTPREVQRAVDANDEAWVFRLIQALDALKETNPQGHRVFMNALQQLDPYYSRVLTSDTTRVLVDASNVARYEKTRAGKGQLKHLLSMRRELRLRGCFPIQLIADASLPYNIDNVQELMTMAKRGEIEFANAGQEADELLAREARRTGAYVVTNDRGFFLKVSPDFEPPRISFRILDGFLIVDDF
ncbi:MAG: hypothetical protein JWN98_447 [Abditibacteriota bacterium]|nr:hypothetical protein [Abditibacteriota bacterium]